MKKIVIAVLLVLGSSFLSADSVWTGNATVEKMDNFPELPDSYRAASNAFPKGTRLLLTNIQSGAEVEVVVVGRLSNPGSFITIEESAGEIVDLPIDSLLPVRVTQVSSDSPLMTLPSPMISLGRFMVYLTTLSGYNDGSEPLIT